MTDLEQVQSQIAWAQGLRDTCEPFTPTEAEAKAAWGKLRGQPRWGSKLLVVWQSDVDWCKEERGAEWGRYARELADEAYLIALPGDRCDDPNDGVVWCPQMHAEKGEGEPVWVQLWVLLANVAVAWVEVVK